MNKLSILGGAVALGLATSAAADAPSQEEMWRMIQQQQKQIEALRAELDEARREASAARDEARTAATQVAQTEEKAEATAIAVDEVIRTAAAPQRDTHIGGYGELHINGGDKDEIDYHRFVLFFGHEFNERLRFDSELEVEHSLAGEGKPGEVEVEQAFIEYDINENLSARGGLFLIPVGILNETHEPPTFYGVERNGVESNIIPSTWWEGGAALHGSFGQGWSWDVAAHSGLKTSPGSSYRIRSGRQKVAEADFKDQAYTGRLKWAGMPGVELAATLQYQDDITQSADPTAGSATLLEAHGIYNRGAFGLRALAAFWELDGDGPEAIGADEQEGWYIEPSWQLSDELGLFARYAEWDNRAGDSADSEFSQVHFGVNYWLHPKVVLKADYQLEDVPAGSSDDDRINLGIGYQF